MNTFPRVASKTDNLNRSRCLLSLAAIQDEMSRTEAGRIGAIHQQTPKRSVSESNALAPDRPKDTG